MLILILIVVVIIIIITEALSAKNEVKSPVFQFFRYVLDEIQ